MSPDQEDQFVNRVLEWYDSNGRHDLPWRASEASPFEVLVAELMLQQTSVGQVRNVYPEFVERYQTPDAVVDSAETDLAEDIRALGLSKRVAYLMRVCERLTGEYAGRVPDERSELLDLHGVGEYTARSVLAHAYGEDTPAVDTNVERVLSRVFESEVGDEPSKDDIQRVAEQLAPAGLSSDFTHALIDFGGEVCTATNPNCADCVVRDICNYYEREED